MRDDPTAAPPDDPALQLVSDDGATRRRRRAAKDKPAQTSKQQLSATIKRVRDLLRQDSGLSGETDRLPQLALLLFLKFVDDYELAREEELGDRHVPVIEPPYRWRDWAGKGFMKEALKGDELIEFVNQELIPYLRDLSDPDRRGLRSIIGEIFQGGRKGTRQKGDEAERGRESFSGRQGGRKGTGVVFRAAAWYIGDFRGAGR